ncbi:MAG: cation diffusion facilitator family transporter [Clostridia bacterium]|nr:cation diffusion facilitator family transporter [Clostridia bacterium]
MRANTKPMTPEARERVIVRTSFVGIGANLLLAAFKTVVGLLSNSIAVVLDAVNNVSDALSSVITIIGTKLAGRKPDKKHPLGHGRYEYLASMLISIIVLYAGLTSFIESVKKVVHPEAASYSTASLLIIAAAVAVKLLLGGYVRNVGRKTDSGALVASGSDALMDAVLSASVLASAIVFILSGVSLEAYVGMLISIFIVKSGIELLRDALDEILGKRVDRAFLEEIRQTICEETCVSGAYDLILHNYGPDQYIGSVHVEIPDTMTAEEIDRMQRRIAQNVYRKHHVVLTGIGIYAVDSINTEASTMRAEITKSVMEYEGVLQLHGFSIDTENKTIVFDIILDFDVDDRERLYRDIERSVRERYPEYSVHITMDIDI